MTQSPLRSCFACLAIAVATCVPALAQYIAPGWGFNPYVGPGGGLAGTAQVINSVGQLNIDNERARVEREAANQAKIVTQRQSFDQMLYERSLKPTVVEDQIFINNRIVARMMNSPNPGEVSQGRTLNTFLPYVLKLAQTGVQGPPASLNPYALRRINITSGPGGPQVGVLRDHPIIWPMALRGPLQQKFDPILRAAVEGATNGSLQPDLFNQVRANVRQIEDDFLARFRGEQISTSDYLVASHFLDNLKIGIRALGMPEVNRFLDGSLVPQGNNVPELSSFMSFNGLTFAPGNPGSEAAYRAIHDAFVSYIRTAQSSNGIQPRMRPPNPLSSNQ